MPWDQHHPPRRLHEFADHWARVTPDAPALVDHDGSRLTYGELGRLIDEAEQELRGRGVRGGERVLVINENCVAAVVLLFAASRLDAWTVLVNARLAAAEIDRIVAHCRPGLILFTHLASPEAGGHADRHHATSWGSGPLAILATPTLPSDPEPVDADAGRQVAVMVYTSGTTGDPKGVMLTHRGIAHVGMVSGIVRGLGSGDLVYAVLPITHAYGLCSTLAGSIAGGACVMLVPRFEAERLADALEAGVSVLQGVPPMYAKFIDYLDRRGRALSAPRLRYLSAGGAPLDVAWKQRIEARLGLALNNGYGLSECCATVSVTPTERPCDDDSIGYPVPGIEVRIVDPDGSDRPDGGTGELWVRGPSVMLGYYRNEAATRAAITPDKWFRTGDLGRRMPDGWLYVCGRLKELIIVSGFNVYPPEVETALNTHPQVVQSAVFGRKIEGDEEVLAVVETAPGATTTEETLKAHARSRLAAYKVPRRIFIVDRLPASPTGKILKGQLAALLQRLLQEEAGRPAKLEQIAS